jgi:regulator of cell morphogenesis and NO signaling
MDFTSDSIISDIVRYDYRAADVFKNHNINFCCSGKISLDDACTSRAIETTSILNELKEATRDIHLPNNLRFDQWNTDFLVDYISNVHHAWLFGEMPSLQGKLLSFMDGHRKKYPELVKIHAVFSELCQTLDAHNKREEEVIFPYIKQVVAAYRRKEPYGSLFVRTLRKPLSSIEQEHHTISDLLSELKALTNNYTFSDNACTNHQVLYHKLRAFHNDLVQHKHLENNILFPKAMEIEKELLVVETND